jgi:hypothetical protein
LRLAGWQTNNYLTWLRKQTASDYGTKESPHLFKPQPWQHLIAVLRKMGHNDTANDIAIAFEKRRYAIKSHWDKVKGCLHPLFGWLAGYGYKPMRLVGWMVGVWFMCGLLYWNAAYQGVFAPSDPLVFQNENYDNCRSVDADSTPRRIDNNNKDQITYNWYTCGALVGEYSTFSPLAFSLDVILPLVDLGQEKTWGTYIDTAKPSMGAEFWQFSHNHWVRLLIWFEILFGWMASLMLVAVLTGLTDRTKQQ